MIIMIAQASTRAPHWPASSTTGYPADLIPPSTWGGVEPGGFPRPASLNCWSHRTLCAQMVCLQAMLTGFAPAILLSHEGHVTVYKAELSCPQSVPGVVHSSQLPKHCVVALPACPSAAPGLANHGRLVSHELFDPLRLVGCHYPRVRAEAL